MNLSRFFVGLLLTAAFLSVFARSGLAEIRSFSSDGCSLFPDGTPDDRTKWCDCCFSHDLAYWQGGSEAERLAADQALHTCIKQRTGDETLAETMYLGVRAGGHPAIPAWYRWGYGWDYGRGYQVLTAEEQTQVERQLSSYVDQHPQGYCSAPTATSRPTTWAVSQPSTRLKNFYKLDDKVYRSAQPSKDGFDELKANGIQNVLSLREYHEDSQGKGLGLKLFQVKMAAGSITTDQVITALRIIHQSQGPILIHCWHGSDRTGMVSAMYRIVFQGWEKEAAIAELTDGGYGYHAFWYGNIPQFIREADIPAIKKAVLAH